MQVKVWNDSDLLHVEEFRGKNITIKPHEFVEMGRAEANKFLHQYREIKKDGAGRLLMAKKLRIERPAEEFAAHTDQPLRFEARDGKMFRTKIGLAEYEATLPPEEKANVGPKRRRKVTPLQP
jgi:hypothetical protein